MYSFFSYINQHKMRPWNHLVTASPLFRYHLDIWFWIDIDNKPIFNIV